MNRVGERYPDISYPGEGEIRGQGQSRYVQTKSKG